MVYENLTYKQVETAFYEAAEKVLDIAISN